MDVGFEIEYFEPESGPIKATAHKSGKLGFTLSANKFIDFEKNKLFKIGKKKENGNGDDMTLFMIPVTEKDDLTFEVFKAGDYYYLKAKRLLKSLNIDYANETESTSFEIDEVKDNDKRYFKLVRKKKRPNNT